MQAPELSWFLKLSQERVKPQAVTESSGGYQVAGEGCRRRRKDRNGKEKKTLPRVVCGFQKLMINVGWRGEKMKRAPWRPENCFLHPLVKHGQLKRAES